MKVNFKYSKLKYQWAKLAVINPGLVYIVLYAIDKMGGSGTLTEILRTKKTQLAYYPGRPYQMSVHQVWRGVDLRTRNMKENDVYNLVLLINTKFPYGKGKIKTAVYHSIGKGFHCHLQNRTVSKLK